MTRLRALTYAMARAMDCGHVCRAHALYCAMRRAYNLIRR